MKNAFYLILKALFVLKIFRFLYWLFGHKEKKGLIKKVTFKIYDVRTWSRNNQYTYQTMKFGQVIEYNNRNFFSKIILKITQGD